MLKFLLCIVFVFSTTYFGFICSQKLSVRKNTLEAIVDSICKMKTFISFGGYEISRVISDSFKDIKGFDWDKYSSDSEAGFINSWNRCVEALPSDLCLNSEDKELLIKFADCLGVTDTEGQLANCELYCDLFKSRVKDAINKEKSSGRLYTVLGFSLGCVVTLILV